ncbi:MAG: hypothetical protein JSV77_09270 [Dehalococcoidales bacterium]|nr:MAG: hypothetical protein JSV77_09270 [Dehalococcoidales bacterium]
MANQSILLAIRRMWEYFAVPPPGDLGFASEEHDPVGEFLEKRNRGGAGLIETETEEVIPMNNLEPETGSSQATADIRPSPVEILEDKPATGPSELESELLPPAADSSRNEAEDEVVQEMTDGKTNLAENDVLQLDDITPDGTEDKTAEGTVAEANQGEVDDLLDIFRSEKEVKETDALHENLVDIDIQDLLQESRDLIADINARRYRKT